MTSPQKVDAWLLGFERRDRKCLYIGGAVAALLVVGGLADKLFAAVCPAFRAWFITLAIFAGAVIGLCKILYEQAATDLTKKKADGTIAGTDELAKDSANLSYPTAGPILFVGGTLLLLAASISLIVASFVAAYAPRKPDTCLIQWDHKSHSTICRSAD